MHKNCMPSRGIAINLVDSNENLLKHFCRNMNIMNLRLQFINLLQTSNKRLSEIKTLTYLLHIELPV